MSYKKAKICLTTKHKKLEAIGPSFNTILGAEIKSIELDTDLLGTFSGEIERKGSALDAAKAKCELGIIETGYKYGLSSEGSFGPHPSIFFIPANIEILYFIDNENDFHLQESMLSTNTNFKTAAIDLIEQLKLFAHQANFPSHALIIRPNISSDNCLIFKGIQDNELLIETFQKSQKSSSDKKVWVETDMRAHMNPTRMNVIKELSLKLANRLKTLCPSCKIPGWGLIGQEKGLLCSFCNFPTAITKYEIFGCAKCSYKEHISSNNSSEFANPQYCKIVTLS